MGLPVGFLLPGGPASGLESTVRAGILVLPLAACIRGVAAKMRVQACTCCLLGETGTLGGVCEREHLHACALGLAAEVPANTPEGRRNWLCRAARDKLPA
jgi:hypothetical protein